MNVEILVNKFIGQINIHLLDMLWDGTDSKFQILDSEF